MVANSSEKLVKAHQMKLNSIYKMQTTNIKWLLFLFLLCISVSLYIGLPLLDIGQENGVLI